MDWKQDNMLSTIHDPDMVNLPSNRHGQVQKKPKVILNYNVGMKGDRLSNPDGFVLLHLQEDQQVV